MVEAPNLARGLRAVEQREWRRARTLLSGSDDIERSAPGLAGLSLACWWLDDGPGFVRARESLFRLHQDRGEVLEAGRVAVRLSWDVEIVGRESALSRAWLDRARTLLARAGAGRADRTLCDLREASLIVADEPHAALALTRVARADARDEGSYDLEVLALVYEGEALFALDEIEAGFRVLEEAALAVCSGDATDPLAVTLAGCRLLEACADVRDYARAAVWLPRVVERSAASERGTMAVIGRCATVPLLLGRGLWREAAAAIEDGLIHFGSGNEGWERSLLASLAELRFRQGRVYEAAALLDRAEPDRRCRLTRASMALEGGDVALACEHASAFLRQSGRRAFPGRAVAFELLAIAEAARGALPAARDARSALSALADRARTPSLVAAVRRADAAIALADGDTDSAIDALLDAVDHYERAGAVYESSAARADLAQVLEACGRGGDAQRHRQLAAAARAGLDEPEAADTACDLTPREVEVLRLVACGLSNAKIAARLTVSPHTVHRHVANILTDLGCSTRAAAVAIATSRGWLA